MGQLLLHCEITSYVNRALDLGSSGRNPLGVRVPPLALTMPFGSLVREMDSPCILVLPGDCENGFRVVKRRP